MFHLVRKGSKTMNLCNCNRRKLETQTPQCINKPSILSCIDLMVSTRAKIISDRITDIQNEARGNCWIQTKPNFFLNGRLRYTCILFSFFYIFSQSLLLSFCMRFNCKSVRNHWMLAIISFSARKKQNKQIIVFI